MQYSPAFEPVMHFLEESKVARDERRKAGEHAALVRARLNKAVIGALALTVVVLGYWNIHTGAYRLGISTLKVAMADESHIPLDFDTKEKLSSTTKRLEEKR